MNYVNLIGARVNIREIEKLLIDKHFTIRNKNGNEGTLVAIYDSRTDMADALFVDEERDLLSVFSSKTSTPRPRYHAVDVKPRAFVAKEND